MIEINCHSITTMKYFNLFQFCVKLYVKASVAREIRVINCCFFFFLSHPARKRKENLLEGWTTSFPLNCIGLNK